MSPNDIKISEPVDPLLSIHELAETLGVHIDTIRGWYRRDPNFPVYRFGHRTLRFHLLEVSEYFRNHKKETL
jgi:DNA-binding transcriptional MerR regulator